MAGRRKSSNLRFEDDAQPVEKRVSITEKDSNERKASIRFEDEEGGGASAGRKQSAIRFASTASSESVQKRPSATRFVLDPSDDLNKSVSSVTSEEPRRTSIRFVDDSDRDCSATPRKRASFASDSAVDLDNTITSQVSVDGRSSVQFDLHPELNSRIAATFHSIDAKCSQDGEVSRDELLQVLKQEPLAARILFKELDTNSDGGISLTEWHAWFDKLTLKGGNDDAEARLEWIEDRIASCDTISTLQGESISTSQRIEIIKKADNAIRKRAAAAFDLIDEKCSKDGEVSRDELLKVLKQERLGAKILFRELDTNSDGGISLTEWHAWFDKLAVKGGVEEAETRLEWIEDRINTCDTVVTPTQESLAPVQRIRIDEEAAEKLRHRAATAFDLIDEKCSKDGEVSRDELLKVLKQERLGAKILFRELDTNSDGGISLTEWHAWFDKLAVRGGVEEAETRLEWIEDRINTCSQTPTPQDESIDPKTRIAVDKEAADTLRKRAAAAFDLIDEKCSKDGEVSRDELLKVLKQERLGAKVLFRELDTNSDGGISLTEWHAWFDKLTLKGGIEEADTRLEWIEDRINTCDTTATPTEESLAPVQRIKVDKEAVEKLKQRATNAFDLIDEKCSKDGEVSRDELLKVLKQERLGAKVLFRELDTNSDGGISLKEWHAWFDKLTLKGGIEEADTRLEWIEDRIITCSETLTPQDDVLPYFDVEASERIRERAKKAFDLIDEKCSKDGEVSRDELLKVLKQERLGAKILFRELDTNSDGGISLVEWYAWFHKLVAKGNVEEAETRLEWIEDRISTCDTITTPTDDSLTPIQRIQIDKMAEQKIRQRAAAAFDLIDEKCSKDGEVSRDELLKVLKQERLGAKVLFRELDTNSDGGISLTEWHAWFDKLTLKGGIEEADTRLEWIEDRINTCSQTPTPQDESIDPKTRIAVDKEAADTLRKRAAAAFDLIDEKCSKDGEVSRDELLKVLKQERLGAKVLFRELDTNSDGGISLTEWHAWFDKLTLKGGIEEADTRLEWIEDRINTCDTTATPQDESIDPFQKIDGYQKAADEVTKRATIAFEQIDEKCSKDGEVSRDELLKVLKQERLGAKILFRELDTNSDGGISLTEWHAWFDKLISRGQIEEAGTRLEWIEDRINTCDTVVTPTEESLAPSQRISIDRIATEKLKARAAAAFDLIDEKCSKDGEVSRDELLKVLKQERLGAKVLFRELDTNSDGGISLKEWHAWFDKLTLKGGIEEADTRLEWIEDRINTCDDVTTPVEESMEPSKRIVVDKKATELIIKRATAAFVFIDSKCSQDGEVSRNELLSVLKQERLGAKVLFRELDTNSDGGISLTEWHAWFDKLTLKGGIEEADTRLEWIEDKIIECRTLSTVTTPTRRVDVHQNVCFYLIITSFS